MRPRKCRLIRSSPVARFYKPRGIPLCDLHIVSLKDEEWEAIFLVDYEGLKQEEASTMMGVSRPTFSRVLASARAAVAKALAEGGALDIGGGDFRLVSMPDKRKSGKQHKEIDMKIAFTTSGTTLSSPMDGRFGRAARFLIYDTDGKSFTVIANESAAASQGAGIKAAENVAKAGANVVVTGDCGPKAFDVLKQAGVKVFISKDATVADSLESYLQGKLPEMTAS
jgi:predicted DNA-binding protein (UPF0251 family)/predicted Fe-Mo cluster-binding NifX family protein